MAYFIQDSVIINDNRDVVNAGIGTFTDINVSGLVTTTNLNVYGELRDTFGNVGAGDSILTTRNGALTWSPVSALGIATDFAPGSTFFVSENGNDANDGTTVNTPWASLTYALTQITPSGNDVLLVSAGEYEETFPLTVPKGLTIKGAGQRATLIKPTQATETQNGFLMDDASAVEDITIGGIYKPAGASNNAYAFSYAVGAAITSRSPYIARVTVLNRGTEVSATDPYGYSSADNYPTTAPGGGAVVIDGSNVDSSSLYAGFLINELTAFAAGNIGVCLINGARVEMSDSFSYFAETAVQIDTDTAVGLAGAGRARLTVVNPTSAIVASDTIEYYDTDGTTVLASGTVDEVSGGYVYLDGAGTGVFEAARDRQAVSVNFVGGAIISNAQAKFGSTSLDVSSATTAAVTAETPKFGFGTGNFTTEGWFYFNALNTERALYDFRNESAGDNRISVTEDGAGNVDVQVAGATIISSTGALLSTGTWHHIAVTRDGTNVRLFIDGALAGSATNASDLGTSASLHLGADFQDTDGFEGFIDDFRVEYGVAKYTATFTPPTAALKGDKDTAILLHFDGANGSTSTNDDTVVYQDIRITGGDTADKVSLADYTQFGGDLRTIGCAFEYGQRGVVADGAGSLAHLVALNFSYIGLGGDISNDPTKVIQANEVIKTNNADIYFTSVDQNGDFRVGDSFYVNQETGTVSFNNTVTDLTSLGSLTITDGTNSSLITPTSGRFGNLQLSGNTLESLTGDINLTAAGAGQINIDGDTNISGILTAASISLGAIQNGNTSVALDQNGDIRFITAGSEAGRFDTNNDLSVVNSLGVGATIVATDIAASDSIVAISSVTAATLYGDGSNLTGIGTESIDGSHITPDSIEVGVTTVSTLLKVDGNTILGDAATDTVIVNADVASNLIPDGQGTRFLGDDGSEWARVYANVGDFNGVGIGLTVENDAFIGGSVSVGSSVTATEYYGDGSKLENVDIDGTHIAPESISTGFITATSIEASGYISVGTTATFGQHVQRNQGATVVGVITATEFDSLSDIRLKENISPIDNALNKLVGITGVSYTWKDSGEATIGVIAQDVHAVFPELIQEQEYMSVNYNGLIGVLIESVKELKDRVEELEAKLND